MAHAFKRPPRGPNADGAATVRNILPWRNMEKEFAKRLAERAARGELDPSTPADDIEPAPDSGVRSSQRPDALGRVDEDPMRPLTFSVYTVSELDEMQGTHAPAPAPAVTPSSSLRSAWSTAWRSTTILVRTVWSWARAGGGRPPLADVARVPFTAFVTDLHVALRRLPWKRIGTTSGIAFGAIAVFLFAVMTVAELTDDLKPTRGVSASRLAERAARSEPRTTGVSGAEPLTTKLAERAARSEPRRGEANATNALEGPIAAPDPAAPAIELDDGPPAPRTRAASKKSKAQQSRGKSKDRPADMFNP